MSQKSQHKKVKSEDDLEQKINTVIVQSEEEEALLDLIIKIIVGLH